MHKPTRSQLVEAARRTNHDRTKLVMAALAFVDLTLAEMDALSGTESASLPAEFMVLHEAATAYREAVRFQEKLKDL